MCFRKKTDLCFRKKTDPLIAPMKIVRKTQSEHEPRRRRQRRKRPCRKSRSEGNVSTSSVELVATPTAPLCSRVFSIFAGLPPLHRSSYSETRRSLLPISDTSRNTPTRISIPNTLLSVSLSELPWCLAELIHGNRLSRVHTKEGILSLDEYSRISSMESKVLRRKCRDWCIQNSRLPPFRGRKGVQNPGHVSSTSTIEPPRRRLPSNYIWACSDVHSTPSETSGERSGSGVGAGALEQYLREALSSLSSGKSLHGFCNKLQKSFSLTCVEVESEHSKSHVSSTDLDKSTVTFVLDVDQPCEISPQDSQPYLMHVVEQHQDSSVRKPVCMKIHQSNFLAPPAPAYSNAHRQVRSPVGRVNCGVSTDNKMVVWKRQPKKRCNNLEAVNENSQGNGKATNVRTRQSAHQFSHQAFENNNNNDIIKKRGRKAVTESPFPGKANQNRRPSFNENASPALRNGPPVKSRMSATYHNTVAGTPQRRAVTPTKAKVKPSLAQSRAKSVSSKMKHPLASSACEEKQQQQQPLHKSSPSKKIPPARPSGGVITKRYPVTRKSSPILEDPDPDDDDPDSVPGQHHHHQQQQQRPRRSVAKLPPRSQSRPRSAADGRPKSSDSRSKLESILRGALDLTRPVCSEFIPESSRELPPTEPTSTDTGLHLLSRILRPKASDS